MMTSPFRSIGRFIADLLDTDDSMRVDQSFFSRLMGVLTLPLRWILGGINFMIHSWASTRSGAAFLKGLPAITALATFFAVWLLYDFIFNDARKIGTNFGYLAYQQKVAPDEPGYSEMFAEKLVEIKPDNDDHKYQLGLAYERSGKLLSALDVMTSIAPIDKPGHVDAHNWLARNYQISRIGELDQKTRDELVRVHSDHAVEIAPDNQLAHLNLASSYLRKLKGLEKGSKEYREKMTLAEEQLTRVAEGELSIAQIHAIPMLIEVRLELGKAAEAKFLMDSAIRRLKPLAYNNADVFELWQSLIRCAMLLKDYPQALEIANEGLASAKDKLVKRKILRLASLAFRKQALEQQDMSDREQYRKRLNALCESIRLNPSDRGVYIHLLDFATNKKSPTSTGQSDNRPDFSGVSEIWLRDSIVGSPSPALIHALLGIRAVSQGNVREGSKHWRISEQQFQGIQNLINNLIEVLANDRPDDFSNILDMASLAIELYPDQPLFYQTRGTHLRNQGQLEGAVADFLYANEKLPKLLTLDQHLINCYEQLGDQEKASKQKLLLAEKMSGLSKKDRALVEASLERLK